MNGGGKIAGPALILVGLLMLLGQMGMPVFGVLWPLILLAIGVGMILRYRQGGEDSGLVFSGVLLILLTILLLGAMAGVLDIGRHWPAFLAAVGISFLAMAQVDSKRRDAMVPGWICLGLAAVLYFFSLGLFAKLLVFVVRVVGALLKVLIPLGLMGFGGWLLFHDRQDSGGGPATDIPEKVSPATAEAPDEAPDGAPDEQDVEDGVTSEAEPELSEAPEPAPDDPAPAEPAPAEEEADFEDVADVAEDDEEPRSGA